MTIAVPPNINETEHGVIASDKLNSKLCRDIIHLSKEIEPIQGAVQSKGSDKTGKVLDIRNVIAYRIHEEMDWVDQLILNMVIDANKTFNYNLSGLFERPQLLKYKAPSIGYGWHTDMGNGDASTRKLGISIALNDEYSGGEFMVFGDGEQQIPLGKGESIVFSSFLPHKVNPINKVERWSLVAWISGSCFR